MTSTCTTRPRAELLHSYQTGGCRSPGAQRFCGGRVQPTGRLPRGRHRCPTMSVRCGCWTRTPWRRPGPPSTCRAERRTRVHDLDFSADGRYLAASMQRTRRRQRVRRRRPVLRAGLGPEVAGPATRGRAHGRRYRKAWRSARTGERSTRPSRSRRTTWRPAGACGRPSTSPGWCSTSARTASCSPPRSTTAGRLVQLRSHPADRCAHRRDACGSCAATTDQPRTCASRDDGRRLASVSYDGQLIVWDVSTGKPLVTADTFEVAFSVDFSPDGHRVYTGGDDGIVADLGPVRRPAVPAPDVRAARRAGLHRRPARRPTAGGWPTSRPTRPESSVRFLDTVTGTGQPRERPRRHSGSVVGGPGIPMVGTTRSSDPSGVVTVLDAQTGKQTPRRRVVKRRGHLLDGLRRQGRTADRRGQRRAE